MKVIIAGGGIGGLTAALCLHHFGLDVEVREAAPALSEVGAGIQISPNGMKVFEALGMSGAIADIAFAPDALEMRLGTSGRRIFQIPITARERRRWGGPYLHIHRADLLRVLEATLRERLPHAVTLNSPVTGYCPQQDHVDVLNGEDAVATGDALIGADGIHSAIRTTMLGEDAPVFTGNVAWRAVVPMDVLGDLVPPPTACVWAGEGRHCVTYRLRRGTLANLVAVVERADWTHESWTEQGTREEALADFAGWHPVLTNLIEKADQHFRWALFDRKPLPRWTDGRVALLGDAAHPMLPFMAQGAVMGIEDAWAVAQCLSEDADAPAALQRYEGVRHARTARVQAAARANAGTFHKSGPAAQLATYGPMWLAGQIIPGVVHTRNDWLYAYDITQALAGA
jgi:salicylate hydroxylase